MHCCNKSRPWLGHPHPHPVSARLRVVRNQETLNCITCVFDVICGILKRWGQRFQLVGHLLTGLQVNHNCPDHPLWLHLMKIFHRNKSQMKKPLGERWCQQRPARYPGFLVKYLCSTQTKIATTIFETLLVHTAVTAWKSWLPRFLLTRL